MYVEIEYYLDKSVIRKFTLTHSLSDKASTTALLVRQTFVLYLTKFSYKLCCYCCRMNVAINLEDLDILKDELISHARDYSFAHGKRFVCLVIITIGCG